MAYEEIGMLFIKKMEKSYWQGGVKFDRIIFVNCGSGWEDNGRHE